MIKFSRRERQVMDIVYAREQATAMEIHEALPDAPTFSATRAVIRTLELKGHLRHEEQGLKYVYLPTTPREDARKSAVAHVVSTFFDGSPARLMASLIDDASGAMSDEELRALEALIQKAKEK